LRVTKYLTGSFQNYSGVVEIYVLPAEHDTLFVFYATYLMIKTRKLNRVQGNVEIKHVYAYISLAVSVLTG
jgi:hypothetical protein